jgi:hypothetical protein
MTDQWRVRYDKSLIGGETSAIVRRIYPYRC